MPVKHVSRHHEALETHRQAVADEQNFGAKQHLNWGDFRVPVDEGRLRQSLRQTEEATPDSPRAVVVAGGIVVNGQFVDWAAAVNNGSHHTSGGGKSYSIPPNLFWTEAEEVGREAVKMKAANRRREMRRRG